MNFHWALSTHFLFDLQNLSLERSFFRLNVAVFVRRFVRVQKRESYGRRLKLDK